MYASEYVSGNLTEITAVICETPKQPTLASVCVSKNLATAYIAIDLAERVNNAFSIVARKDLADLFSSFEGNGAIRHVATHDIAISNGTRESEDVPLPTTVSLGERPTETVATKSDSMIVFNYTAKDDQFVANIQQSRRKNGRERQFSLTAEMAAQVFSDADLETSLREMLELWPTSNETIEVGGIHKYSVHREYQSYKTTITFTITGTGS